MPDKIKKYTGNHLGIIYVYIDELEIEQHIIKDCISGKREAQKRLYDALSGKMMFVCVRYCKNYDDAQDVLQDGFMKVFRNIGAFKFEGSFEGWVRRIMVNTAITFLAQQKQKSIFVDIDDIPLSIESDTDAVGLINEKDLLKILDLLPVGYRTVFNMYAIEGYSHKEIADELHISEGTSKSQLSKAKVYLKNLMHQYFEVDEKVKSHE